MKKIIIIAEAGPNHNGKLKRAYQLVDAAKKIAKKILTFDFKNYEKKVFFDLYKNLIN